MELDDGLPPVDVDAPPPLPLPPAPDDALELLGADDPVLPEDDALAEDAPSGACEHAVAAAATVMRSDSPVGAAKEGGGFIGGAPVQPMCHPGSCVSGVGAIGGITMVRSARSCCRTQQTAEN